MVRLVAAAAAFVALMAVARAQAPSPSPAEPRQVQLFLEQLQRASEADDRTAVAAMIRFPITIGIGGFRVPIADTASFLSRYDDIFNPPLRAAIARGEIQAAPGGFIIGANDIVIGLVNGHPIVTSIAVPAFADDGGASAVPPVDRPAGARRPAVPRRVAIRVGPRPTQIPGTLAGDTIDSLILFLPKGRLASIRLERVPAGSAAIRVVHARTGAPLAARTSSDGRFVSGRAADDGDYRIEVRRTGATDNGHLPYMLSLSLR